MQFVMQPGMVYDFPLWWVALLLIGLAALGAVSLELVAHRFLSIEFRRRHNDVAAAIFSVHRSNFRGAAGLRGNAGLGWFQ